MKKSSIIIVLLLMGTLYEGFAQKKCTNRFDTTLSRKHELTIAFGMGNGGTFWSFVQTYSRLPSISVNYAKVYKHNHFLRTGFRGMMGSGGFGWSNNSSIYLPAEPGFSDSSDYSSVIKTNVNYSGNIGSATGFIGYEYGKGRKKTRFTVGADVHIGYMSVRTSSSATKYAETRTLDSLSGFYNYQIQFLGSGMKFERNHILYVGLTPRFGIRRDISRRFALSAVLAPQIGYMRTLSYKGYLVGDDLFSYKFPDGIGFLSLNAEFQFTVKLGK
ncbi:MAG: hypothetical protein MH137_13320 [Flavobacteriales bacterium]|nr:hypothetical protein [Flavobacteriales bacterium]